MQRPTATHCQLLISAAAVAAVALGCARRPKYPPPPPPGPLAGVSLRVVVPSTDFAVALGPLAGQWAARTGAAVAVVPGSPPEDPAADVGVVSSDVLGGMAERGDIVPVPAGVLADRGYHWSDGVLSAFRLRLPVWGGAVVALPLAGSGHVVVYRTDRLSDPRAVAAFTKRFAREPAPPATWEDFAEWAEVLTDLDGKPALPPLPASDGDLVDLFFRAAASFDRPAQTAPTPKGTDALSFAHDVATAAPRLESPGFVTAAGWLARTNRCRSTEPGDALLDGRASLAIVSLADLARLPREAGEVPSRFGVAPLPGARTATGSNYVPYLSGGRFGVVRSRCARPDAAFDLLLDLGGPARSLELVSTAGVAGPFRSSHLTERPPWLGYGFDPARTRQLQDAVRHEVGASVTNPAVGLRGPDRSALTTALAVELRRAAAGDGTAAEAMRRATEAWRKLDEAHPLAERIGWRRRAVGLP